MIAQGTVLTGTFARVPAGYQISYTGTQAILRAGVDYPTWSAGYTFANPAVDRLPDADPDGDGLTNQQEYAFGLDPTSGASVNPVTVPFDARTGTFSYTRRKSAQPPLSYVILTSPTLGAATWTNDPGALQTVTATAGEIETVRVTVSPGLLATPRLFTRVAAQ